MTKLRRVDLRPGTLFNYVWESYCGFYWAADLVHGAMPSRYFVAMPAGITTPRTPTPCVMGVDAGRGYLDAEVIVEWEPPVDPEIAKRKLTRSDQIGEARRSMRR
jgi:hypothetical protein